MAFGIDLWKIVLESNCSEETKNNIRIGLDDLYAKAKAFDEISKYVKRKLSAEAPLDDDYLIGRFESYETIQEFMERADDER